VAALRTCATASGTASSGNQLSSTPSPRRPANASIRGFSAASITGSRGRVGGKPSLKPSTSWPAVTALIAATAASSRANGSLHRAPNQRSVENLAPAPRPSTKRPPDRSSRVAAVWAITRGGREKTGITPVPSRTRLVVPANVASVVTASWPPTSGTQMPL
jgi:hypothetical protein